MTYQVAKLNTIASVIAMWDDDLNTYNNCYLLRENGLNILIDSGKISQSPLLMIGLTQLDVLPSSITHVVCTHGHKDHVGGGSALPNAARFVPAADVNLLAAEVRSLYAPLPDLLPELGLEIIYLGHHTKGHVGFYHQRSKTLYTGDYLTFFGESVAHYGLVTEGGPLRDKMADVIDRWLHSPAVEARYNTAQFRAGLAQLASFDAEYLCTGHGPVLLGGIRQFLNQLA